jgi:SNF2 family DNA or RNA helicase
LYSDQITGVSYLYNNKRAGLFDVMGVGKSIEALAAVVALGPAIKRTLIVCPKAVIMGFQREVLKHTHLKSIAVPSGAKAVPFLHKIKDDPVWDVLFVHPENLISRTGRKHEVYGPVTSILSSWNFDMVIVDEWHQYKEVTAKRTKCILSMLSSIKDRSGLPCRVIVMTGTPISESPSNAYVTLKVLSSETLPHISRFENFFLIKKEVSYGYKGTFSKVVGYKNLGELKKRLERVSIRRVKSDLKGFPQRILTVRDVELSGRQKDLYKAACGELLASLPNESKINVESFFSGNAHAIRIRQLLNSPLFLEDDCASAKHDAVDDILDELFSDPEQKVVLWTEYRKGVDIIYDRWNEKYGVEKIYGGIDINEALAKSFESNDAPRIAACIPAKAGVGVDFLARARTSIYIDRPYSFTFFQQSLDRIHRRVSGNAPASDLERIRSQPATLIFLDMVGTLDELIREKLQLKGDVSQALTTNNQKLVELGRSDLLKYLK